MILEQAISRERAFANLQARDKVRLMNPQTGQFLHLSGNGATPTARLAWLGTRDQAQELRRRARIAGRDWPYRMIPRGLVDFSPSLADWKGDDE